MNVVDSGTYFAVVLEFYSIKLDPENKDGVGYITTACMDPWSTSVEFMDELAYVMRNAILNAVGRVRSTIVAL